MNKMQKKTRHDLLTVEASRRLGDDRWKQFGYSTTLALKAWAGAAAIIAVAAFTRIVTPGYEKFVKAMNDSRPAVIVAWHGSLMIPIYCFRKRNIVIMTSLSEDGDTLTRILYMMGFGAVRGSSSRGGMRGLLEMVKLMNSGMNGAITVDGPRGPRKEVKAGAVVLAKKANALLVPIGLGYSNPLYLKNWDKTEIPLPGSTAVMVTGDPFGIADDITIEDGCKLIRDRIMQCEAEACEHIKLARG